MNNNVEKLVRAKELICEVEEDFIRTRRCCPYEIGFTLRNLDEAIAHVKRMEGESKENE
ncbi:MAG: hypothetical protein GX568_09395 [Candidatus Gastranaerophilales bacterium]|nr:hypothetical protein [Candidatus Gastranaerophilales bacterium]